MGGSSPQKPKSPPPSPAPVRADSAAGEQAYVGANRRQGLQKTINPANPLAPSTALGSIGSLGTGGEGVMINTRPRPASNEWSYPNNITYAGGIKKIRQARIQEANRNA